MKNFLVIVCLLSYLSFNLSAQTTFGETSNAPGNNSCDGVRLTSDADPGYGGISFPVPVGLTLADLEQLSTDYRLETQAGGGSPRFQIRVQTPSMGLKNIFVYLGTPPSYSDAPSPVYVSTGNLLSPTSLVDASQIGGIFYNPYANVQATYGSYAVTGISVVVDAGWAVPGGSQSVLIDNVVVNNGAPYTFEDCDNDGVPDSYDCDPSSKKNNKILLCHNGHTICVSQNAQQAHLNHGDQLGPCANGNRGGVTEITDITEDFKITVAPNPVISTANIKYELPVDAKVSIVLFDPQGKAVNTLVNADRKAGVYNYQLDASKLPAGIYYYRMTAIAGDQQFVQGQKLMIVK